MQDRGRPHEEQPEVHRDPAWKRRRSGDGEHLHRRQPGPNEAGLPVTPTPGSGHGLMPGPVVWNRRDTGGPAHPVRRGSSRPLVPGRRMASGAPPRIYGLWQDVGRADPGPVHWPLWPAPFPPLFGGLGLAHADDAVPNTTAVAMAPATRRFFMSPPSALLATKAVSKQLPSICPSSHRSLPARSATRPWASPPALRDPEATRGHAEA
jgi:hypothetical protein